MSKEGHFFYLICIFGPKSTLLQRKSMGLKMTLYIDGFQIDSLKVFTIMLNETVRQKIPLYSILIT